MITTKYNFKMWLNKHYPDIVATPVYGISAYLLNKAMEPADMFEYNVQQLPSGQYIVFLGVEVSTIQTYLDQIKQQGLPRRVNETREAPTTFSCFEKWIKRHELRYKHRTFCAHMTPADCFQTKHVLSCDKPLERKTWYMYEFDLTDVKELEAELGVTSIFHCVPHIITNTDTVVALVKASQSTYVSKRQRFLQKFALMQPIYEQFIAKCAEADKDDRLRQYTAASQEWVEAKGICEQYMGIQFEHEGTVDIDKMKEAYRNGTINLFVRDINNLCFDVTEDF